MLKRKLEWTHKTVEGKTRLKLPRICKCLCLYQATVLEEIKSTHALSEIWNKSTLQNLGFPAKWKNRFANFFFENSHRFRFLSQNSMWNFTKKIAKCEKNFAIFAKVFFLWKPYAELMCSMLISLFKIIG